MMPLAGGAACVQGYKLVCIFYNASWCNQGCGNFRGALKYAYMDWNKDDQKNIQIITVSMDRSEDEFETTMEEIPWVSLPWGSEQKDECMDVSDPKGTHPTLAIFNGTTGELLDNDGFSTFDLKGKDHFYKTYMGKV